MLLLNFPLHCIFFLLKNYTPPCAYGASAARDVHSLGFSRALVETLVEVHLETTGCGEDWMGPQVRLRSWWKSMC